jgi:peptide/nickel transport system substrate-binding protein
MRKRTLLATLVTLAISTVAMSQAPASKAAATPIRGGELTVMMDIQPASMDPLMGNGFNSDPNIYNMVYDKLITLDAGGNPVPALAESWMLSDDARGLVVRLRKGVTFHDGTPFNAEAVKFNLERAAAPSSKAPASAFIGDVISVDVVDPLTVKINLKANAGPFSSISSKAGTAVLTALAIQPGMMVSPTAFNADPQGYARKPVGTGPFKFVEWVGGDRLSVERNPSYWRNAPDQKALPYLNRVTVRFASNSSVKLVQLQSGVAQLADAIPAKDWDKVRNIKELELIMRPQVMSSFLTFNTTAAPFNNKDLRLAVSHAIDKKMIEKVITKGLGQVYPTMWGPLDWTHDPKVTASEYNLQKAREHYAKSGHRGRLTLTIIQRDPDTQIAQLIQAQLKQAGIDAGVEVLERLSAVEKLNTKRYEMGLARGFSPVQDPDFVFSAFHGKNAKQNFSGQTNEQLFAAVEAARISLDKNQRKKHYSEAQQILMDNAYYVYLHGTPIYEARRTNLNGLKRESAGEWVLSEAWLAR